MHSKEKRLVSSSSSRWSRHDIHFRRKCTYESFQSTYESFQSRHTTAKYVQNAFWIIWEYILKKRDLRVIAFAAHNCPCVSKMYAKHILNNWKDILTTRDLRVISLTAQDCSPLHEVTTSYALWLCLERETEKEGGGICERCRLQCQRIPQSAGT